MYELNRKIKDLTPYNPIEGNYRVRLDANESYQSLPPVLMSKVLEAAAFTAFNRYPDPTSGKPCRAFAKYYGVPEAYVTAGNGSDELISLIMNAFLMRGEKMLTIAPDFSMYRFYASLCEAACIELQKGEDLTIDAEELIRISNEEGVRLIAFSNPCNPTSLGLNREQVRHIIRSVKALVVLDEAYMDFWDQSLLHEVNQYDNLIILRTCSKAFGMAAIRLGFAVANTVLTIVLRAVKSPYNVNTITQEIGAVILSEKKLYQEALTNILNSKKALYASMKDLEMQHSGSMKVFESCTNFVLVKLEHAKEIHQKLLSRGIAVRLLGNYLRVTAGSAEENEDFLSHFKELL